ncbi:MAG: hypothetical protein V4493_01340 [Pseudomonadota bacterium]
MPNDLFVKRNRPATQLVIATYTRPADTNVYAAGDVLAQSTSAATILTLTNMARGAGLGGIIQSVNMIDSSVQSTKPDIDLHIFDTAPTMQNDNVAWSPSDAERLRELCVLTFSGGNFKSSSNNGSISTGVLSLPYLCVSGSQNLYAIAVVRNAYTPTSGEVFTWNFLIIPD